MITGCSVKSISLLSTSDRRLKDSKASSNFGGCIGEAISSRNSESAIGSRLIASQ